VATFGQAIRRGLPRRPGGEPWPPAAEAPVAVDVSDVVASRPATRQDVTHSGVPGSRVVRRGLPRVPGGEPWPPASAAPAAPVAAAAASVAVPAAREDTGRAAPAPEVTASADAVRLGRSAPSLSDRGGVPLRRGLPRVPGGEPWPPAGAVRAVLVADAAASAATTRHEAIPEAGADAAASVAVVETAPVKDYSTPLPFTRTVWAGKSAFTHPAPKPEPQRIGPFTKGQWAGAVIVAGGGLLFAAALAVVFVRWFLSLEFMQDFLATYPGEYHLPEGAPVGIPPWLGWQHFFNVFLMVLIIRSGLQVRTEKRPTAFWSPRSNGKRKISLNLWFHQSLDILWIVNGVIFVVLLFVTGQWMKIVPTSWEVIPNAISAGLQYVSLNWPTENGWVNYNSLQQLAYFATVFLAAPLAIVTGVRMSGIWPTNAKTLNRVYPVEWARAVHFPVMLYFVVFIAIHVFLVFATGALRNLNHMYASQGSTDPTAYAENWTGFWFFVASLVVIAAAWVAARPLVLAPIARLFGKVSGR